MSKLILAMIAMAGFGVAAAQAPAPKQNEVGSVTQQAMQQQEFAGEQAKVQNTPKKKTTNKQKQAEVQSTTTQAMQQQEFAGEQAKVQKTPKPKVTDKQKAAEVQGTTTQAIKQDGSK